MANNKFFVAKNGILTPIRGVFGSSTDDGINTLQVSGPSLLSGPAEITNSAANTYSLLVKNTAGTVPALLADFVGDLHTFSITNPIAGVYDIGVGVNEIRFFADTNGIDIRYDNASRLAITSAGNDFTGLATTSIEGNRILTTADEGSGNGLDADTIDGLDSLQFLRSDESDTMFGSLTITGDLTVSGNTTYVDTEQILLSDNIITLNANHTGAPTQDAGIEINRGSSANTYLLWSESTDEWKFDNDIIIDTADPQITLLGDDSVGYRIKVDEAEERLELGQTVNKNLFLNFDGTAEFNANVSITGTLDATDNISTVEDVYGKKFIDVNDPTFIMNPNDNSRLNDITLVGSIIHDGDTNTVLTFPADDQFSIKTGNDTRVLVTNTYTDITTEVRSTKFVDRDDSGYYADFANTSISIIANGEIRTDHVFSSTTTDAYGNATPDTDEMRMSGYGLLGNRTGNPIYVTNAGGDVQIGNGSAHNVDAGLLVTPTQVISYRDIYAPKLIDSNNNAFYLDPSDATTSMEVAGDILIGGSGVFEDDISANNATFSGDVDATGDITAENMTANGNVLVRGELEVWGDVTANNDVFVTNRVYATQFRDIDNTSFYGDFAGTSRINDISLVGEIRNDNNTNNYIDFTTTNRLAIFTTEGEQFRFDGTYSESFVEMRAPVYYDSGNLDYFGDFAATSNMESINLFNRIHGWNDTGTNIDFDGTNTFRIFTGGAQRFEVNNTYAVALDQMNSPVFVDHNNSAFYGDFASSSRLNIIDLVGSINDNGDANTSISFTEDVFSVSTGGAERVTVENTAVRSTVEIIAPRFVDANDQSYYMDPQSGGNVAGSWDWNNGAINNLNNLSFNDPGPNEGIAWLGGNSWKIYESPDDLATNAGGNLQFVTGSTMQMRITTDGDVYAARDFYGSSFIDSDNNSFLVNPAGATTLNDLDIQGTLTGVDATFSGDIAANNVTANTAMYSPIYYDADDVNFYGDFNSRSHLSSLSLNVGGNAAIIVANAALDVDGQVAIRGVSELYMGVTTASVNSWKTRTFATATGTMQMDANAFQWGNDGYGVGSGSRATLDNTGAFEAIGSVTSPIFYDSADSNFYWNPNEGNAHRFQTTSGYVRIGPQNTGYSHFNTDRAQYYFDKPVQFDGSISGYGGTETATFDFFIDAGDSAYFLDPQASSVLNRINLVDKIRSNGDTDTWIKFPNANEFEIVTGGLQRVEVTDTTTTVRSTNFYASNLIDYNNNSYFVDLDQSLSVAAAGSARFGIVGNGNRATDTFALQPDGGIALNTQGWGGGTENPQIAVSGDNGGNQLLVLNRIDSINPNPWDPAAMFIDMRNEGASIAALSSEGNGNNIFMLLNDTPADPSSQNGFQIWTGDTFLPVAHFAHDQSIYFGTYIATYTDTDNTALTTQPSSNKFHFEGGSIQLNGANDAIVFGGTGISTFLKDEELAFGWGGGIYMTEATTLKVRNDKDFSTGGDIYGNQLIDADDNAFYVNPSAGSNISAPLVINDGPSTNSPLVNIIANDSIPWALKFSRADLAGAGPQLYASSATRLVIDSQLESYTDMIARIFYDRDDTNFYGDFAGTSLMRRANFYSGEANGEINVGRGSTQRINLYVDDNTGYLRYYQDETGTNDHSFYFQIQSSSSGANQFYFNRPVTITGDVTATNAYADIYYDANDITFYTDPHLNSRMNDITMTGEIIHDGDTDTYLQFNAADSWRVVTGGSARLLVNNTTVRALNQIQSPIYYDWTNTAWYVNPNSDSRLKTITLDDNAVQLTQPTGSFGSLQITGGDVGGYEGFSIGGRYLLMHNGASTAGLYDDVNNQWGLLHNMGSSVELRYANITEAETQDGYFLATNEIRSPIFRDTTTPTTRYVDPAGTSQINVLRANRIYPAYDNNTGIYIDYPTGDYGSIQVNGGGKGGWEGYSINGRYVLMSADDTRVGIYNDLDNEWMQQWYRNAGTLLYYNGIQQAQTGNGYFTADNEMRAPVYYGTNNTSAYYYPNRTGNTQTQLSMTGQIVRSNFNTTGGGDDNKFLVAQDYSSWVWNTATNWGIFWAGNDNPSYSYFGTTNPNEMVFVGSGNVRASIDLDTGDAFFGGEVYADNFNIVGPAANISLNPAYGSGGADLVLFDFTTYSEAEIGYVLQDNESNNIGANFYEDPVSPFAGKAWTVSDYRVFYSDYIPVAPGEEIYGEISEKYISGSVQGRTYYGVERFDKDRRPIAGNTGCTYFVRGGQIAGNTGWETRRGHTTIPTSHTPYNGSDGGGVHYVRIRILMNYPDGTGLYANRAYGGIMLKRRNAESNLLVDDLEADDILSDEITANIFRDRADPSNYYLDPASTSYLNDVRANIFYDRNDPTYYFNGNGDTSIRVYGEISNSNYAVGNLQPGALNIGRTDTNYNFADGTWASDIRSGIHANFSETWEMTLHDSGDEVNSAIFYDGTDDLFIGRDIGWGNMRITAPGSFYAPRFYDSNDPNYYGDFGAESRLARLNVESTAATRIFQVRKTGSAPGNNVTARFSHERGNHSWGLVAEFVTESGTDSDRPSIGYFSTGRTGWSTGMFDTNDYEVRYNHGYRFGGWGTTAVKTNTTESRFYGSNGIYAKRFYDLDDPTYYMDPNATSNIVGLNTAGTFTANGIFYVDDVQQYDATDPSGLTNAPISTRNRDYNIGTTAAYLPLTHQTALYNSGYRTHVSTGLYKVPSGWGDAQTGWYMAIGGNDSYPTQAFKLTYGGYINNTLGYVGFNQTVYAPIIRDNNNGNYYVDMASRSVMSSINIDDDIRFNVGAEARFYTAAGNLRGYMQATDTDDAHLIIATSGNEDIVFRDGGLSGTSNFLIRGNGDTLTTRYTYAQRFIDSNNGTYYGDFASTSIMNTIDNRGEIYNDGWFRNDTLGRGLYNTASAMHFYSDDINRWRVYSVRSDNKMLFTTTSNIARGWIEANNANDFGLKNNADDWRIKIRGGARVDIPHSTGIAAVRWEDYNSPGTYYLDLDGSSYLSAVFAYNWFRPLGRTGVYFQSYGTGIWAAGAGSTSSGGESAGASPYGNVATYGVSGRGGWNGYAHSNSYVMMSNGYDSGSSRIHLGQARYWGVYRLNPSRWLMLYDRNSDVTTHYGQINISGVGIYAERYYDSNDATFYGDFNGTSIVRSLDVRGTIDNDGEFINNATSLGLRNSATGVNWYSDGSNRMILATPAGDSYIRFQTGNTTTRGYVYTDTAPSIGFLHQGGNWALRSVSTSYLYNYNGLFYTAEVRPTSGSTFWRYQVNSFLRAPTVYADTIYFGRSSANGYAQRYGTYSSSLHRIAYISFDWNGNANSYSNHGIASTRYDGSFNADMSINSYADITLRVDTNNNNGTSYVRNTFGTTSNGGRLSQYLQQNISYAYNFTLGDSRAYIFRDASDANYYLDLNSTSSAYGSRFRTGTLYGPNLTWGAYLAVGTNGRQGFSSSYASVATTNGNLHLDARAGGYGLYLNYYSTGDTYVRRVLRFGDAYDFNNPKYRILWSETSRFQNIDAYGSYGNPYPGGNSGITRSSQPYRWGFQEDGAWSFPYPDTVFQYHTGMKFAAWQDYEGMRFYQDYNSSALRFQINGTSGYSYKYTWMKTDTTGFYTDTNGGHIYPNQSTSYGSWNILGNRNGWYGFAFSQVTALPHLMFQGGREGAGGIYWQSRGWSQYWVWDRFCQGVGTSATSSAYTMYVNGAIYATSNIVAYSDRRKKENIHTIDGALDILLNLRGVYYTLKDPEEVAEREHITLEEASARKSGVIAQEVLEHFPDVVTYAEDRDEYGVDYGKMGGLFIEAIKGQQDIINSQQEQIDELKSMVNKLLENI